MVQVEVLSSSLTNDSRVSLVLVNVVPDSFPQVSENVGRSGKVKTGKVLVVDTLTDNLWWVSRNELNDGWWNTSFKEDLVGNVGSQGGSWRWFPDDYVSDDCWGKDKVTTDGGEVEGRDGKDETFESSVFRSADVSSWWKDDKIVLTSKHLESFLVVEWRTYPRRI